QASLEHCRFAEHARDARKEAIEHEQLPTAGQVGTGLGRIAQPLFQRGLECGRRCVRARLHAPSPLAIARSTAVAWALLTIPRASAWLTAEERKSGERWSAAQSASVLAGEVTGTVPTHARS